MALATHVAAGVIAAGLLTGCGADEPERVSLAGACQLIWNGIGSRSETGGDGPLIGVIQFAAKEGSYTPEGVAAAKADLADLGQIADRSPAGLERQLQTVIDETTQLIEVANTGETWESIDLKAAGFDVVDMCEPYESTY